MIEDRPEKSRLVRQAYLVFPLGFSIVFGAVLLLSDALLSSATSIIFLLLTPVAGAAGYRSRR